MHFIHGCLLDDGYNIESHKPSDFPPHLHYGKARKGMDTIKWNENGNFLSIQKDAETRTAFNGVVRNLGELRTILELVR